MSDLNGLRNFRSLFTTVTLNKDRCIEWYRTVGLIPRNRDRSKCRRPINVYPSSQEYEKIETCVGLNFICTRKACKASTL